MLVTGVTAGVASGSGSGRVPGEPQPERLCEHRGQSQHDRAHSGVGAGGSVDTGVALVRCQRLQQHQYQCGH